MSSTGLPREVTTFKLRDEWVRLAAVQKLSPILRVVGMRLAHFYNGETGQLNPSYSWLAQECATTERTAQKAVAEFRKLGMIADTRVPGGHHDATNDFVLIIPYRRVSKRTPVKSKPRVSKRTPVKPKSGARTGVRAGSGRVSIQVADGCPPVHPNSVMNSVMNSERAAHGAHTADAARDSTLTDSATAPDETPNQRAPSALIETVTAQPSPPSRANPKAMGTPANGSADPAFAEVYQRGREVLGDDADAVTAKLIAAYVDDVEGALDAICAAEGEKNPRKFIESDIAATVRHRRSRQ